MIYMFLSNNPSSGDINLSNLSCFIFDWFFFNFVGNEDNHKILDGFEIRQYPTDS